MGGELFPVAVAHQLIEVLREVAESMQFQDWLISGGRAVEADVAPNPLTTFRQSRLIRSGDDEAAACYLEVLALTPRLGKAFIDLRHNNLFSVGAGAERMKANTIAMATRKPQHGRTDCGDCDRYHW